MLHTPIIRKNTIKVIYFNRKLTIKNHYIKLEIILTWHLKDISLEMFENFTIDTDLHDTFFPNHKSHFCSTKKKWFWI